MVRISRCATCRKRKPASYHLQPAVRRLWRRMLFVTVFWTCCVIPVFAVYAFAPKVLGAMNAAVTAHRSVRCDYLLFVVGCIVATRISTGSAAAHAPAQLLVVRAGLARPGAFSQCRMLDPGALWGLCIVHWRCPSTQLVYPNEMFPTEIRASQLAWAHPCRGSVRQSAPVWYPFPSTCSASAQPCMSLQPSRW